ncbi:hypothetical protein HDU92_005697 [Lobulomyces angularis]|nr:hypothetical protein HDU92_005697 [Lobulomyces angularis]
MTGCQGPVLSRLPTSKDMLVKAKTGTGKTIAFLIAALEKIKSKDENAWNEILAGKQQTSIIIISPTRELAFQTLTETQKMCKFLPLKSVLICGGEDRRQQLLKLMRERCDIIVATPGRLLDFLDNSRNISEVFSKTKVLVLDEADTLLEMGFREDIEKIVNYLPKERETLMFSATISKETKLIAAQALRKDFLHIDCVPANDVESHFAIRQSYITSTFSQQLPLILDILQRHKESTPNGKIIVFFPTASMVAFFSQVFLRISELNIIEIHSKLSQGKRVRASNFFRRSTNGILFTTDVSARGVDYPDVTLVLQVGIPSTRDLYIHRIGRTGRAGKDGEAILILSPFEKEFLREIRNLNIKEDVRYNSVMASAKKENVDKIKKILQNAPEEEALDCFFTWVGHMRGVFGKYRLRNDNLDIAASEFGKQMLAIESPPRIRVQESKRSNYSGGSQRRSNFERNDMQGVGRGLSSYQNRYNSYNNDSNDFNAGNGKKRYDYKSGRNGGKVDERSSYDRGNRYDSRGDFNGSKNTSRGSRNSSFERRGDRDGARGSRNNNISSDFYSRGNKESGYVKKGQFRTYSNLARLTINDERSLECFRTISATEAKLVCRNESEKI